MLNKTLIKNPEAIAKTYNIITDHGTVLASLDNYREAERLCRKLENEEESFADGSYILHLGVWTEKVMHEEREFLWNERDPDEWGNQWAELKCNKDDYVTYYAADGVVRTEYVNMAEILTALHLSEVFCEEGDWFFWYGTH